MTPPDDPSPAEALLAHREWVARAARGLVYGEADAEDVEQQAWVEILERPPVQVPDAPRGWLARMLQFRAIDAARTAGTRRRHERAAARPERVDASPAELVARAESLDRVAHAVLALDEPYRAAVLLRYFEDLSAQEIARRVGAPVETVRTRIKRGLATLRQRLDAEHGGDRRAWVLALLPVCDGNGTDPGSGITSGAGVGTSGTGAVLGGMLMGISMKAVAAGVVVAVVASAIWFGVSTGGDAVEDSKLSTEMDAGGDRTAERAARPERSRVEDVPDADPDATTVATEAFQGARLAIRVLTLPEATPIEGATVTVTPPEGDAFEPFAITTGADGRASRDALPAGPCTLVARAPGRVRADLTATLETGRESVVEARLAAGGTVTGIVLDARDARPLAGATVTVVPGGAVASGGATSSMMKFGSPYGSVETDAQGRFRIDGVEQGEIVTARATARGHGPAAESFVLPAVANSAREIALRLPRGGTLSGTVRLPDGLPAAGATVYVLPADAEDLLATPWATTTTGARTIRALEGRVAADGTYQVDGLELGATYMAIAVRRDIGRSSPARGLAPTDGETSLRADFGIRAAPGVRVRVLRPDGTPARGAQVRLFALAFADLFPETEPGVYVLAMAAPGRFPLHVDAEGFTGVRTEVEIPEEGVAQAEVRLQDGLVLAGVLVDDAGKPMPGVTMVVDRPWQMAGKVPPSQGRTTTDAAGRFRFEGLRSGTHAVILVQVKGGGVDDNLRVEVPADDARIVVRRAGIVRARLVAPAGGVVPDTFTVAITRRPGGAESTSRIGAKCEDGVLTVEVVSLEAIRIVLELDGWAPVARNVNVAPGAVADLGEIVLDAGFVLEGRVVDSGGSPVAGASVSAGDLWTATRQDATTDDEGRFALPHLARGATEVEVSAEGFLAATAQADVPAASPLVVTLQRGGMLVVRVADAAGKPKAGVNVRMTRAGALPDTFEAESTDHRGRIEQRVAPGRWTVRLCDDTWTDLTDPAAAKEVDVTEGTDAIVDLSAPAAPPRK